MNLPKKGSIRPVPVLVAMLALALAGCARSETPPAGDGTSDKPAVQIDTKVFGPYDLVPNGLMQTPGGVLTTSFKEPIWLLGYKTEIVDERGNVVDKDLHCHTMFKTMYTDEWIRRISRPFKGLFSDGNTSELFVPEGFGVFYDSGEPIEFIPMFNNRNSFPIRAGMRATLSYVLDKDLDEPLTPLYSIVESVVNPHLYHVSPGEDVREREYSFPFDGAIHMIGIHIHPYGRSVELINKTRDETVWKSVAELNSEGTVLRMPVYFNEEGYPVKADEEYLMRAIYENPTDQPQDAMAGLVVFFSTADGKLPQPDPSLPEAEEISQHSGHQH